MKPQGVQAQSNDIAEESMDVVSQGLENSSCLGLRILLILLLEHIFVKVHELHSLLVEQQ